MLWDGFQFLSHRSLDACAPDFAKSERQLISECLVVLRRAYATRSHADNRAGADELFGSPEGER